MIKKLVFDVFIPDFVSVQASKVPTEPFACPNCGVQRSAAKFAPHLDKCMGRGGRETRRAASVKLTTQPKPSLVGSCSSFHSKSFVSFSLQFDEAFDDSTSLDDNDSTFRTKGRYDIFVDHLMQAESILKQRTNEEEADSQEACLSRPVYVRPAPRLDS